MVSAVVTYERSVLRTLPASLDRVKVLFLGLNYCVFVTMVTALSCVAYPSSATGQMNYNNNVCLCLFKEWFPVFPSKWCTRRET